MSVQLGHVEYKKDYGFKDVTIINKINIYYLSKKRERNRIRTWYEY